MPWYVGNTGTFVATFRNAQRQRADAVGVAITITRVSSGEVVVQESGPAITQDGIGVYRYDWTPAAAGEYLAVMRGVVDGWPEVCPVRVRVLEAREVPLA